TDTIPPRPRSRPQTRLHAGRPGTGSSGRLGCALAGQERLGMSTLGARPHRNTPPAYLPWPKGTRMPRHIEYRDLEPAERRAPMMRSAGMSPAAIGQFLDVDYVTVAAILKRPRVARFLLALESTMLDGVNKDSVKNLNDAIEQATHEAFSVEVDVMRRLYRREYDVRAQLGAAATAQDILDR